MKKFVINLINLISKKAPSTKSNFRHCDLKHSLDQLGQLELRNSSKGFTLIEIILYMALLSIFLLTLTDIFVSILDVQLESDATSAVEQDGRFLLSRLAYDINRANAITTPGAIGSSSNSLEMTIAADTYTYTLSGSDLQLTVNFGTLNNLNGSETAVSNLSFQKIANSAVVGTKETIKINFTISSVTQRTQGPEVRNFQTTIGRR